MATQGEATMARADFPAPDQGFLLTHFLVVSDMDRSREFYTRLLGGTVVVERSPVMIKVANSWLILNEGGGPTDDKPDVILETPPDSKRTSAFLNIRVPPPQDAHHRRRQVVAIDRHIKDARGDLDTITGLRHARDAMPPILCGDFNAQPDSDEIRFLNGFTMLEGHTTYYQDAWRVAGDGPGYTEGDWRTNPLAASLNVPPQRIDYVFVGDSFQRKGNAGRVISAQLAFHEPITGCHASDHAGLVVDVVWPNRPG
jgi:catechol 2,3-dioxygenase-like lactoylglutathione lyase family enzyme